MMKKSETLEPFTFFFFIIFFSFKSIAGDGDGDCLPASCRPGGPLVRFPFRLRGQQPLRCGFPGFDLSCGEQNQTLIKLPSSRSYVVKQISYKLQMINIDPDFCGRDRIVNFDLSGTPFFFSNLQRYTFLNCSSQNLGFMDPAVPGTLIPCLGSLNHTVIAVRTAWFAPSDFLSCRRMTTISLPVRQYSDLLDELEMMWIMPFCRACEVEGRTCGFAGNGGIDCFGSSRRIPRVAKLGLGIGIGVSALLCLIGLGCYMVGRVHNDDENQNRGIDLLSITITPQPASSTGLDAPTIQSYPKTVIGDSFRLPNDDRTCPICLSDYEPKEALRTIPECNHYFHADCIDKWLKLKSTCPVCRNSPESSSLVTPCSSMSSDSSNSSLAINQ